MKSSYLLAIALVVCATSVMTAAAEDSISQKKASPQSIKSGPLEGDYVWPFHVTKVAGAENDGVKVGENLCYRCRHGGRPQVIVFTRSTKKPVLELVRALDEAAVRNELSQLCVFVNLLGKDKEKLSSEARQLAKVSKSKRVPIVVPNDFKEGPESYKLNRKAEVTVILATRGQVKATFAAAKAADIDREKVVTDLKKILN